MKNLILFAIVIIANNSYSQTDSLKASSEPIEWNFRDSKKIIKVSPGNIFSQIPMFGADLEFTYKNDISFQVGAAIIPSFFQLQVGDLLNDFDRLSGYNLRGESRFYILKKPNHYLAAGVNFRHLIIKDDVPVGMNAVGENPQQQDFEYFINTKMRFHRFNTDVNLKWGFQRTFAKHFVFDFYAGLSLNTIGVQSFSKIPSGGIVADNWNNQFTLVDNFRESNIRPLIGFKFGYKLK